MSALGWGEKLRALAALEAAWQAQMRAKGQRYMPYPIPQFITYLADAVMAAPGDRFLDVGAGPGVKMELARDLFGLSVAGVEIDPGMAHDALARGLRVVCTDARTWDGYAQADIVYMNRPFEDDQQAMERAIMKAMAPGAVLISVNGALLPSAEEGWLAVAEEADEPVRGVWAKP